MARPSFIIFTFSFSLLLLAIGQIGQIFFINRTASMPTGIYKRLDLLRSNIGDIIVFKTDSNRDNLIKYVAGIVNDEFCFDESIDLWINGIPVAKNNIEKYPQSLPDQSTCQILNPDELLVLGEHQDSYDSRYFGPIKTNQVIAKVKLILPFE